MARWSDLTVIIGFSDKRIQRANHENKDVHHRHAAESLLPYLAYIPMDRRDVHPKQKQDENCA
jgi:hypothetical protein